MVNDLSGFCPSDVVETAQADMIFEAASDLRTSLLKPYWEKDESKKVNCKVAVTKNSVQSFWPPLISSTFIYVVKT